MAIDPNIKKKADDIRNKVYGREVRESLASGLEAMSSDVVETVGRQDEVEGQFQSVIENTTDKDVISAPEIIAARNGESNLKARLDKENQEVTAQLAHKGMTTVFGDKLNDINAFYGTKNIHVLSDSIGHGANVADMANDSWTGILRKMIQLDYNTKNHGFVNLRSSLDNGAYKDIIDVETVGAWATSNSENHVGGYYYTSTDPNGKLKITIKEPNKRLEIFHDTSEDNVSTFDVVIGGDVVGTYSTGGRDRFDFVTGVINIEPYEFPLTVEIVRKDNIPSRFTGIQLYDNRSHVFFQNFSRSGQRLTTVSNDTLDKITDCNILFFGIGHNDVYGGASLSDFKSKIDYVIQKVNTNGSLLVVSDFIWHDDMSNDFRKELKRLHEEVPNSIYLPFPDYIWGDDNRSKWLDKDFLDDSSHPTMFGHQKIAESTAKGLGLSVTSKSLVEDLANSYRSFEEKETDNWVIVENLQNDWEHILTQDRYKTKYKKIGDVVYIELFVKGGTANSVVFNIPEGYRPNAHFRFSIPVSGAGIAFIQVQEGGDVIVTSETTVNIQGTFSYVATS